jgi:hypothetical protein
VINSLRRDKMEKQDGSSSTRTWIQVGAGLFIIALIVSALAVPQLRLLHFLQSLIYIAIVILARRKSAWAYGAGVAIGVALNSLNLFVTHLMLAGVAVFWSFLQTGHVQRVETMMVSVGGIAHFIIIIACLAAFYNQPKNNKNWWNFAGGAVLTLAYMVLIVIIARPQ